MATLDVTEQDIQAITMVNTGFEKAIFPMIEGSEVTNLATSRAQLVSLRSRIAKHLKEQNEVAAKKMAEKAAKPKELSKKS